MAKDDTELNLDIDEPKGSMLKWIIIGVVLLVVLGGIGAGVYFFLSSGDKKADTTEEAKPAEAEPVVPVKGPAQYVSIPQAFLANIAAGNGRMRILQVKVELMVRSNESFEATKHNVPLIQNTLRNVFSSVTYDEIKTAEGKEKMRENALLKVQEVMTAETGKPTVEQVLFTDFVMQ